MQRKDYNGYFSETVESTSLKGKCDEIFYLWFFHEWSPVCQKAFRIWLLIWGDIFDFLLALLAGSHYLLEILQKLCVVVNMESRYCLQPQSIEPRITAVTHVPILRHVVYF
jgi:hypothetical protein